MSRNATRHVSSLVPYPRLPGSASLETQKGKAAGIAKLTGSYGYHFACSQSAVAAHIDVSSRVRNTDDQQQCVPSALNFGVPMDDALRLFALEVHDSSADDVVSALRLAATSRAQRLVELLGALADSTRDEVTMRLRVEASRASARSGVRTVICFSIGFVALLMVVARSYLAPYASITGQLVLVLVGVCYGAGLILMVRLVRPRSWQGPVGPVREGLRV